MKKFRVPFKKIVWGWAEVTADSIDNFDQLLDPGNFVDEFDNKTEYEFDENNIEEVE